MSKKRIRILIAVGVVAIITAVVLKRSFGKQGLEVYVEKTEKGNITEIVSANGKVQPEVEVSISPEVAGEIIEVRVAEGDKVKEGDLLVKINPDLLESARDRVEASMNTARANLSNAKARKAQADARLIQAKASYERSKKLYDQKAISEAEYETALSQFEVAKAEVEAAEQSVSASQFNIRSAEATLKEAERNLLRTEIRAPMDGTISMLDVETGEKVVGTAQMAGTEMLRLANLENMEVNVEVNENDIIRVSLGDTADIEVDAYVDRKFQGIVTEVANTANSSIMQSADQVATFEVKVRILRSSYEDLIDPKNPHLSPFRPGMSAIVDIKTDRVLDVIKIPIQAVSLREDTTIEAENSDDRQRECVFLYVEGESKLRFIESGIQDSEYIEITEGLEEGEEIISGPYSAVTKKLKDGKKVQVIDQEETFGEDTEE
jgi:HlyD family secretion protein